MSYIIYEIRDIGLKKRFFSHLWHNNPIGKTVANIFVLCSPPRQILWQVLILLTVQTRHRQMEKQSQ